MVTKILKKGMRFMLFYSALDILTIAIKITLTDFKNRNRMLLTKVTIIVTKI